MGTHGSAGTNEREQRRVMARKRTTYLIQDPYDADALAFIRTIFTYFGLRPLCFYTDEKGRFYGERQFPLLRSDVVEASYNVEVDNLPSFASAVRDHYEIRGVVPYREDTVEVAAELCGLLDLDWNSRRTLSRFRDKFALKKHIRRSDPSVRIPECRLVRTVQDLDQRSLPSTFVIKPNNGLGNQNIGVFRAGERDAVSAHLDSCPGVEWILEEYIGGTEYHIDGQIRADGEVTILALLQYFRAEVNGYPTVYLGEGQCRTNHPRFEQVSDYARQLLTATGLRSCPFHLEVKVDERGPCIIDLGARLPSEGGGHMLSRLHPNRPDTYAVAAHDYLGEHDFAREPVDWSHYNNELTVLVYGVSNADCIIQQLSGLRTVESMPEFVNWVIKPRIGDRVITTKDLRGAPYIVELRHRGAHEQSERLIDTVHAAIRWNDAQHAGAWFKAQAHQMVRRGAPKLTWLAHNLTGRY